MGVLLLVSRLQDLGGVCFYPCAEADEVDGLEATVDPWVENIMAALQQALQDVKQQQTQPGEAPAVATRPTSAAAAEPSKDAAAVQQESSAGVAAEGVAGSPATGLSAQGELFIAVPRSSCGGQRYRRGSL